MPGEPDPVPGARGRSSRSSTRSPSARRSSSPRPSASRGGASPRPARCCGARFPRGFPRRARSGTASRSAARSPGGVGRSGRSARSWSGSRRGRHTGWSSSRARARSGGTRCARSRSAASCAPSRRPGRRHGASSSRTSRRLPAGEERDARIGRSRRGRDVLEHLDALGRPATAAEIREATGAGPAVLKRLTELGLLRRFEQDRRETPRPRAESRRRTRRRPRRRRRSTASPRRSATAASSRRCSRA